jgi:hypothetical protein
MGGQVLFFAHFFIWFNKYGRDAIVQHFHLYIFYRSGWRHDKSRASLRQTPPVRPGPT